MAERIAVIGATGRTGIECVRLVLEQGHICVAICRNEEKAYSVLSCVPRTQRSALHIVQVDNIENQAAISAAIRGCKAVIFAACGVSLLGIFNRSGGPRHVDFGGVKTVVEALQNLGTQGVQDDTQNGAQDSSQDSSHNLSAQNLHAQNLSATRPKMVLISSLGVTRPYWPIHIMLNALAGRVMTYKLRGEDILRASASTLNYTIIRPGRLVPVEKHPQLRDAPLVSDQGDKITGQILRADVARIAVHCAIHEEAANKATFELISAQSCNIEPEHQATVQHAESRSVSCADLVARLKSDLQIARG